MLLSAIAERLDCRSSFPRAEEDIVDRAFADRPELLRILKDGPGISPLPCAERRPPMPNPE
jgi:hypothetical protein